MSDDYEYEEKEVTKTKPFITINGEELLAWTVHEFIKDLEGTDGFTTVRWCHEYDKIAKPMIEEGLVHRDNRGSWYAGDEEKLEELKNFLEHKFYE